MDTRPQPQREQTCEMIELMASEILCDIKEVSLLADQIGHSQLAASLRDQIGQITNVLTTLQEDRPCGSELWLG
jgi:hypothetical protein